MKDILLGSPLVAYKSQIHSSMTILCLINSSYPYQINTLVIGPICIMIGPNGEKI